MSEPSPEHVADATETAGAGPKPWRRRLPARIGSWVLTAALIAGPPLLLKTYLIPSSSMASTLENGDRVVVSKWSYKFTSPERGDVIVFDRPTGTPGNYPQLIKRIVAVEGDQVSIRNGRLLIDGETVDEPYLDAGVVTATLPGCGLEFQEAMETRAGLRIPDGHVFVLGDNRADSADGRCFGPVPESAIRGEALAIAWPPSNIGTL